MVAKRIVPVLREAGYRGTAGTYTLTAPGGDVAIVNLQKSRWNSADEVAFTVNLAIVPVPWFDWQQKEHGLASKARLREYHGLWRDRLRPSPTLSEERDFWVVRDETTADACAADVTAKLRQDGLPRLSSLLDRPALIEAVRAGDFGFIKMSPTLPLAVILSDHGPSRELEDAVRSLQADQGWLEASRNEAVGWIRDRSQLRRRQDKQDLS